MNRAMILGGAALFLLAGCLANNETSVQVVNAYQRSAETCEPTSTYASDGILDVGAPGGTLSYTQAFEVENNLFDTSDPTTTTDYRLDTSRFIADKAVVTYTGVEDRITNLLSSYTSETPTAITVLSGTPVTATVTLVPSNIGQLLNSNLMDGEIVTVVATFHLEGHTADGSALSSSEFSFPVQVCKGCIQAACGTDTPVYGCSVGQSPYACVAPDTTTTP